MRRWHSADNWKNVAQKAELFNKLATSITLTNNVFCTYR